MGDDYQLRKDIDKMKSSLYDVQSDALKLLSKEEFEEFKEQYQLDGFITGDEVNSLISNIETDGLDVDLTDYYRKSETDDLLLVKADKSDIPTKTSQLTNDSGFITSNSDFVTDDELNTILSSYVLSSALNNYALKSELFSKSYNDLTDKPVIPQYTSDLTDDVGYLTSHQSLDDYYTKTESDSKYLTEHQSLSNYVTNSHLNELIYDTLVTVNQLTVTLRDYPSISQVTSALGRYVLKTDFNNIINTLANKNHTHSIGDITSTEDKYGFALWSIDHTQGGLFDSHLSYDSLDEIVRYNGSELATLEDIEASGGIVIDDNVSSNSSNPVKSSGIYSALQGKADTNHTHELSDITDSDTIATLENLLFELVHTHNSWSSTYTDTSRTSYARFYKMGNLVFMQFYIYAKNLATKNNYRLLTNENIPENIRPVQNSTHVINYASATNNIQLQIRTTGEIYAYPYLDSISPTMAGIVPYISV